MLEGPLLDQSTDHTGMGFVVGAELGAGLVAVVPSPDWLLQTPPLTCQFLQSAFSTLHYEKENKNIMKN